jgi:hypothetical protein
MDQPLQMCSRNVRIQLTFNLLQIVARNNGREYIVNKNNELNKGLANLLIREKVKQN